MSRDNRASAIVREAVRAGYQTISSPAAGWLVRSSCASQVAAGELDFLLEGRAERLPSPGGGRSRLVTLRLADRPAVAKRMMHGGILGSMLGDLYFGERRVREQALLADRLISSGVATPEVLAVGWRRVLGPLRTQTIVTRAIPGALNLYQAVRESCGPRRRTILKSVAGLVRALHDAGFQHADLNVTNLVFGDGPDGARLHVVDLDRGRCHRQLGLAPRFRALARLLRSYEKWIAPTAPLTPREGLLFLRIYCRGDFPLMRRLRWALRIYRSWLPFRRLAWGRGRPRLPGPSTRERPEE